MVKRKFLLPLLLLAGFACTEKIEMRIPSQRVYLELDLTYNDKALNALYSHKIYTKDNIDQANEYTGFGGVLVFHGDNDIFYAFDAACPYEAQSNVIVTVENGDINAICPKCGSKYELLYGVGNPVSGPSEYYLQRYPVSRSGNKIFVGY